MRDWLMMITDRTFMASGWKKYIYNKFEHSVNEKNMNFRSCHHFI